MDIYDTLAYFEETLLPGITVELPPGDATPEEFTIAKVWNPMPDANQTLTDLPAVIMEVELEEVRFYPAFLQQWFTIHLQVFIGRADAEARKKAQIGMAFIRALNVALSGDQRLGGTISVIRKVSSPGPAVARLPWNNIGYIGVDIEIDVTLQEAMVHAA